ncbi:Methyltransferase [Candidatus Desulfarcum epimagneticum]|uniref:Methyltransferase n=1 Tax=uncultured Desulfobacteraceae bacterium TaxID=218296 RepID=A0A484HND9_9BACT|nr:Methyltransferase [uncultured Desulfobacteraceae bacterium]
MKNKKGLPGGRYKPLLKQDIEKIHQKTLEVFSEIGIRVNAPAAFELFQEAGATGDKSSHIIKIPPELVEKIMGTAPSEVILYGREEHGAADLRLCGANVHMGTGGTALNVQDPGASDIRPSELKDIVDMARVVDQLDQIHFYMLNVYPNELEMDEVDVNRFGAALNYTQKHVMGGVYTAEGVENVIKMARLIAGSDKALKEKPFISMVTCVISPFVIDENYGRLTMNVAENGIPLVVPAEPLCGATAPVTLAGNLLVLNVDTLAGVMLAQLTNPGTPVLYGCVSSVTDLRDMKYLAGAVEMGLLNASAAQLAQFYNIPIYATAGMSDAKTNDAQAGYESAISSLLTALAGGNFIHDAAGFIEFCMTASYDKLIIDNEIIGMVMRAVEGIRVDDETLAFDLMKKIGPGGHFVSERHTRRLMRSEHYAPRLSDRNHRDKWRENGARDAGQRAAQKAAAFLRAPKKPYLPEEVRAEILRAIPGIRPMVMS